MKTIRRFICMLLAMFIAVNLLGSFTVSSKELPDSDSMKLLQESSELMAVSSSPYISINIHNTLTTDATGTKYKYEIYLRSVAGDLSIISATKLSTLEIKTSSGGSKLFSVTSTTTYDYPMGSSSNIPIGVFYRSINTPLTSAYIKTTGASVYGYSSGWLSVSNLQGTVTINSPSEIVLDR